MDTMSSADTDVSAELTSSIVGTTTPTMTQAAPPTDGAPLETSLAGGNGSGSGNDSEIGAGNGTSWSRTTSVFASPSGSPGLQGAPLGSNGVKGVEMGSVLALGGLVLGVGGWVV